jgi:hypothetical protein
MRPSKWLVFIRPSLVGFDRPLTDFPCRAAAQFNNALQPTATALAVLRVIILHLSPFGFAQLQPRSSWLWLSLIR